MPRRKTLRVTKRAKRKSQEEPVGEDLTKESKTSKIEVLVSDFDIQVDIFLLDLKANYDQLLVDIEKRYKSIHRLLPKAILNQKISEYCKSGLVANSEADRQDLDELTRTTTKLRKTKAPPRTMDPISEDGMNIPPTKALLKPSRTGRATRTSRKPIETPMNRMKQRSALDTPLQTPAFCSHLPQTPSMGGRGPRKMRLGESLFLISENGSPVQLEDAPVLFSRDMANSRTDSICVFNQDIQARLGKGIKGRYQFA